MKLKVTGFTLKDGSMELLVHQDGLDVPMYIENLHVISPHTWGGTYCFYIGTNGQILKNVVIDLEAKTLEVLGN